MNASARMPAIFFGHGTPMNTLARNRYTETWRKLGESVPRPKAILCVSAHWYTHGTGVTAMEQPETIHDFYGFPQALFDVQYPAPGDPALAARVRDLLAPVDVDLDQTWGLDHGTWSVLVHAFPDARVPVVQLSIDGMQPPRFHYELGKQLAPLRDEGVLVIGSGNVVHNLRVLNRLDDAPAFDWAVRFNDRVRDALARRDHDALVDYADARRGRGAIGADAGALPPVALRRGAAGRGRADVVRGRRDRQGVARHAHRGSRQP